jgi:hypothetical protein
MALNTKTTPAIFEHPDGYTVGYSDGHLICIDDSDTSVCIPIGPMGLIDLGLKLGALGLAQLGGTA